MIKNLRSLGIKTVQGISFLATILLSFGPPQLGHASPLLQEDLPACSGAITLGCDDVQVILMIDDSNSMRINDPTNRRFASVDNVIDILMTKYLDSIAAGIDQPPQYNVAAIHFGSAPAETQLGWITIAPEPGSQEDYKQQKSEIYNQLIPQDVINKWLGSTNFILPFKAAENLLSQIEAPDANGCPNRIVLVLTDGAPARANVLRNAELEGHMEDVARIIENSFSSPGTLIYATVFRDIGDFHWEKVAPHWEAITNEASETMQTVDEQSLASRMADLIAPRIGFFSDPNEIEQLDVPANLDSLRITYFAPLPGTSLDVFDPNGDLIEPDKERITLDQIGSTAQKLTIKKPMPGQYQFASSSPGGSIHLLFEYPDQSTQIESSTTNLLQFSNNQLSFRLLDMNGSPIQFSEDDRPRFAAHFTQSEQSVEGSNLTADGDTFYMTYMPLEAGTARMELDVKASDSNGQECLFYQAETEFQIDPIAVIAQPPSDMVCVPSQMPLTIPLQLINARTGEPTGIDLEVNWQTESVDTSGTPIEDAINVVSQDMGMYELKLFAAQAEDILTTMTASAARDSNSYEFFQQELPTTNLIPDQLHVLQLDGVLNQADSLTEQLNRWFNGSGPDKQADYLIGSPLMNSFGKQEILISAHMLHTDSRESDPGIRQFSAQLVPVGSGESGEPSNNWQPTDGENYSLVLQAPAPGSYRVVITPNEDITQDKVVACIEIGALPTLNITIIRNPWIIVIVISILTVLMILLIRSILRMLYCNRGPAIVSMIYDGFMVNAPSNQASREIAALESETPLQILEDVTGAAKKLRESGKWLLVVKQVVGYIMEQHIEDADQPVLRPLEKGWVEVRAEPAANSEVLIKVSQPAPVMLLEQADGWFKVQVTVTGYVQANLVKARSKSDFWLRFPHKPFILSLLDDDLLKDFPTFEAGHQVASLNSLNPLMVLEDETSALEKIDEKSGWLLVQTRQTGFVPSNCIDVESQAGIHVEPGSYLDVYEAPAVDRETVLGLSHPVQAAVLEQAGDWLKVEVLATGYVEASRVKPPTVRKISCRKDRPKIRPKQEKPQDQRPDDQDETEKEQDDLKVIEGIGPVVESILYADGITTYKQLAETEHRIDELKLRLKKIGFHYMYPYTWPEQAKLAAADDWAGLQELKDQLKRGRPVEEHKPDLGNKKSEPPGNTETD